jgi:hypothetical protein
MWILVTAISAISLMWISSCASPAPRPGSPDRPDGRPAEDGNVAVPPAHPTLEQMVGISPCIFTGTVVSMRYGTHDRVGKDYPYTFVRFAGVEFIRGAKAVPVEPGGTLEISHLGGVGPDLIGLELSIQPEFELGARYLVFLRGGGWRLSPIPGGNAGYYRLSGAAKGDADVLTPAGEPIAGFENGYPVPARRTQSREVRREVQEEAISLEQARAAGIAPDKPLSPEQIEQREAELRKQESREPEPKREPDSASGFEAQWDRVLRLSKLTQMIERAVARTAGKYPQFERLSLKPVPFPAEGFRVQQPKTD